MLEEILEEILVGILAVPLDYKEIKPINPKGNQPWLFIGRTDAETEAPILWPPDAKSRLIGKDPDAEKGRRQEEKGATEDEMAGWHHQVNNMRLSKLQEMVKDQETWRAAVCGLQRVRHNWASEQQQQNRAHLPMQET